MTPDVAWYAAVIESMAEGVIVYGTDGRALLVNQRALDLVGLDRRQVLGEQPVDASWKPVDAEGKPLHFAELPVSQVLRTGAPVTNLLMGVRRTDGIVWLSSNVELVRNEAREVIALVATFRDATEVKVGRDIDRVTRELASRLVEIPLGSMDQVIDEYLRALGLVGDAHRVLYVALDRDLGVVEMTHDWAEDGDELSSQAEAVPVDLFARLIGRLARREIVTLTDRADLVEDRYEVTPRLENWGLESAVAAPVLRSDVLCGFVVIGWIQPSAPDPRLVDFIAMAAELLAARFEREDAHEDLQRLNSSLDERVQERSAELAREQQRTQAFIDAIPDLMFEFDPQGVFVQVHSPDSSVLPIQADSYIGRHVMEVLGAQTEDVVGTQVRDEMEDAIRRVRDASSLEVIEYNILLGGTEFRFECRLVRKVDGGFLAVIRDVTGEAERAKALRDQSIKLAHANRELQRAVQARDDFLAGISHELRTPLNAILGHTEMLLDESYGPLTAKQRSSIGTVDTSGHHLLDLINDLLDLSRMNATMSTLDLADANVDDVCRLAIELVRHRAVAKGLRLEFVDASNHATLVADERRLKQVLLNLLDNAVKFTEPGGSIGLQVAKPDHAHLAFTVWDTGIGIDAADRTTVFEPFAQVDSGLGRRQQGSGLGLALVERLVSLHGGRIDLDSEVGRGSRFTVVVPVAGPVTGLADDGHETSETRPIDRTGAISGTPPTG